MNRKAIWGLLVGATLVCGSAQGGLLPLHLTVTPEGENYRYTYSLVLQSDSIIRAGDYFTIYDFAGLVDGQNTQPANFSYSSALVGPTPARLNPEDHGGIDNLSWMYEGPDTKVGQVSLGDFSAVSRYGRTTEDFFTGQSHRQVDGQLNNNITDTNVPVPAVPEPASLLLLAAGLPLAWVARRRLTRSAVIG